MTHDAEGRLAQFAGYWQQWQDTTAFPFPVEDVLDKAAADALAVLQALADTRSAVADYENRITWHTTCQQCATVLDRAIADYERAERAEAERDRLRTELADTRQQLDEAIDLDRSALKHQELRDERHRAVKAWHDEHKRAKAAEADRDEAQRIAQRSFGYWMAGHPLKLVAADPTHARNCARLLGLDALPGWLTDEPRQPAHAPGECPTPCDDDCDSDCHEGHEVPYKRTHQVPAAGPTTRQDHDTAPACGPAPGQADA